MNPLVMSCVIVLSASLATLPPRGDQQRDFPVCIVVELDAVPPVAVGIHHARLEARSFDRRAHEAEVLRSQDRFLERLRQEGISFRLTQTPLQIRGATLQKENRFAFLINAIGVSVPTWAVDRIRSMEEVKRVTEDEPLSLHLDNSVRYVRASDGPGNKTIFSQSGGPPTRFDGSGQVIAILDTGIEHTHPAFDTRFGDADFALRTGDVRAVRLAGEPYLEGTHHPKVVYYLTLTASTNEDDVGHGTHCAADSAGLLVQGPGLDRVPGNADDRIIEGVAPGALLMAYKVCETTFTCAGTLNIVTALEDALSPTDPVGNPKPVATVINMSFGGGSGDPDAPTAVAADNAALLGAVVVASAGNGGPGERTIGAPAAGRRVIAVGACKDPGSFPNESDVLVPDPGRYGVPSSTGPQDDTGRPVAPEDLTIKTIIMAGVPDVTFPLGQHYVYTGTADTPDQVPVAVAGRIALAARGSTVDLGVSGSGAFANKAAEAASKGAVALLVFNNVEGELEAATAVASTIPVYGISKANGEYLRDALGFQSPLFDRDNPLTWGTISDFPIRINPPDPANFDPDTTGFSSRGPIQGNRHVKPDVTAPGENIYSATIPAGGASTGGTMSDPSRFISVSGTSFSGPHVAGSAALLRQALLQELGVSPIDPLELRSGAGAAGQQAQNEFVPQSVVRAALQNTATNLRETDGETPVADDDERTFVHELGSGLIHVAEAVDVRAIMGTNDQNGRSGPDSALDPDFLPTYSFGTNQVINTGRVDQAKRITVTLENTTGLSAAGTYTLALVDGGAQRGEVSRAIVGTTGFEVFLSASAVGLGSSVGAQATFDVTVEVDGRPAPDGLAPATDRNGLAMTEFLWWVVASGTNGELLRMTFSYRAIPPNPEFKRAQPTLREIVDDGTPDQTPAGVDRDGRFRLRWTYPPPPLALTPCSFVIERATEVFGIFADDAQEPLLLSENSTWSGEDWVSAIHPDTGSNSYSPVYADGQELRLTMIDPVVLPAGRRVTLSYDSFEDIQTGRDTARVEASGNGGPFLPLAIHSGSFSGRRQVDLTSLAGQAVRVRFRFITDGAGSAPQFLGWFIDNIELQSSDFRAIATVDGTTSSYLVALDEPKTRFTGERTVFFRVGGLFDRDCSENGPFSNQRSITIAP